MSKGGRCIKGFTLLEVLMALIFFALIGIVLQQVTSATVAQYHTIRLKTFASWIAENKLAEMRIASSLPAAREYKEDISYANMDWQVVSKLITTENPDINRVEVQVSHVDEESNEKRQQFSLTGFVGRY